MSEEIKLTLEEPSAPSLTLDSFGKEAEEKKEEKPKEKGGFFKKFFG